MPFSSDQIKTLSILAPAVSAVLVVALYKSSLLLTIFSRLASPILRCLRADDSSSSSSLPPVAPVSIIQTLSALSSRDAPIFLLDQARRVGTIYRLPIGPPGVGLVVVGDASIARQILNDPTSTKPRRPYLLFDAVAGTDEPSFFTDDGARWKHVRKSTASAFAPSRVERMKDVVRSNLADFIDHTLEPKIDRGESFDVDEEMQRITVRVIVEAGFDHRMTEGELDEFLLSFRTAYLEYARNVRLNPLRRFFPSLFAGARRAREAVRFLRSFARRMLDGHRLRRGRGDADAAAEKTTLVAAIDDDDEYASDEERITDIIVYLAGGFDTTAHTLAWALLELSRNPEEQVYLHRDLVGDGSLLSASSSRAVQNVVRETSRLHAVAAMGSARALSRDVKVGKYTLPKGAACLMPYFVIHRNENVFEDADSFRPRRWEEGRPDCPSTGTILPFASGRRNCMGQALALAELNIILTELCKGYEFSVEEGGKYDYFVTWKTVGTRLVAKKRTDNAVASHMQMD